MLIRRAHGFALKEQKKENNKNEMMFLVGVYRCMYVHPKCCCVAPKAVGKKTEQKHHENTKECLRILLLYIKRERKTLYILFLKNIFERHLKKNKWN